jgi:photosystem II stability/assembly factor-like uncharacterized protein
VRRIHALARTGADAYAATNVGVFRSTDDGQSWQPVAEGLPALLGRPIEVDVLLADDGLVLAGTRGEGVFRLDGTRWHPLGPPRDASATTIIDTVPVRAMALTPEALFISLNDEGGVLRRARPLP